MPFCILSLSGGGFFGLYTAAILKALEEKAGKPLGQCFDLMAGTSVGGILALGLAAEKSAEQIQAAFEKNGEQIFSSRPSAKTGIAKARDFFRSSYAPKYGNSGLKLTISEIVGAETRMGNLKHPVIVPAVNVTKGQPQVFKTGHHPTFERDPKLRVVDVALATSAAPTFFPLAEVGDSLFVDGGLYANSPDLMAIHEAEYFFKQTAADIHLLSIGTTTAQFSFSHASGKDLGIWQWAQGEKLIQTTMSAQQSAVDFMTRHKLEDRYLRIDAVQSKEQERDLALDVATPDAQKTIRGLAEASIQKFIGHPLLNSILQNKAATPKFYHVG